MQEIYNKLKNLFYDEPFLYFLTKHVSIRVPTFVQATDIFLFRGQDKYNFKKDF